MKKDEKPILFTGKMVNAILENKKFITRRLLKKQPPKSIDYFKYINQYRMCGMSVDVGYPLYDIKPIYWPDLKLWVRETWGITMYSKEPGYEISVIYKADNWEKYYIDLNNEELYYRLVTREIRYLTNTVQKFSQIPPDKKILWRSNMFLPRAASRILLNVIDVKIERLHELDDTEAVLEGCKNREEYIQVWDNINKKSGFPWKDNPWVYRISFVRINDVN